MLICYCNASGDESRPPCTVWGRREGKKFTPTFFIQIKFQFAALGRRGEKRLSNDGFWLFSNKLHKRRQITPCGCFYTSSMCLQWTAGGLDLNQVEAGVPVSEDDWQSQMDPGDEIVVPLPITQGTVLQIPNGCTGSSLNSAWSIKLSHSLTNRLFMFWCRTSLVAQINNTCHICLHYCFGLVKLLPDTWG